MTHSRAFALLFHGKKKKLQTLQDTFWIITAKEAFLFCDSKFMQFEAEIEFSGGRRVGYLMCRSPAGVRRFDTSSSAASS